MDLSNIRIAPQTKDEAAAGTALTTAPTTAASLPAASAPESEPDTQVAVSVSLRAVLDVQQRVHDTLGVMLPLSTFIARATDVANDDLPLSKTHTPSPDELFNQVLGLHKVSKTSRGNYIPQITALPSPLGPRGVASKPAATAAPTKRADIIDILSGGSSKASAPPKRPLRTAQLGINAGKEQALNTLSISVPKGEEKRARTFLERVKTVLQVEPGRLVL